MHGRTRTGRWRAISGAGLLCLLGLMAPAGGQEEPAPERPAREAPGPSAEAPAETERPSERSRVAERATDDEKAAEPSASPHEADRPKGATRPHREEAPPEGEATPQTESESPARGPAGPGGIVPSPLPLPAVPAAPQAPESAPAADAAQPASAPEAAKPPEPHSSSPEPAKGPSEPPYVPRTAPSPRETQVLQALSALAREAEPPAAGRSAPSRAEQSLTNRVSLWNSELRAEAARATKLRVDLESDRRRLAGQKRSLPWQVRQGRVPLSKAAELRDGLWGEQKRYDTLYDQLVAAAESLGERLVTYEAALAEAKRLRLSAALVSDLEDSVAQARRIQRDLQIAADVAVANARAAGDVLALLLPAMQSARTRGVLWRTEARVSLSTIATAVADLRAVAARLPESIWDMPTVDGGLLADGAQVWVLGLIGKLLGILALGLGLPWVGRRIRHGLLDVARRRTPEGSEAEVDAATFRLLRGLDALRAALTFAFIYAAVRILPLTPQMTVLLTTLAAAWCGYFVARPLLRLLLVPESSELRLAGCDDAAAARLFLLSRLALLVTAVFVPVTRFLAAIGYTRADVVLGLELAYGLSSGVLVVLITNSYGGPLCLISARDEALATRLRANAYVLNPAVSLLAVALFVTGTTGYINLAAYLARGLLCSLVLFALLWHAHRWLRGLIHRHLPPLAGEPDTHAQRRAQLQRFVACWGEGLGVAAAAVLGGLYSWGVRGHHLHRLVEYLSIPLLDIKGAKVSILGLLWGLLVVALAMGVARIVRDNVRNAQTFKERWDPGARHAIGSLLYYGIVVAGFVVGILVAGMQLGVLTAFAGLVGVAVGFGSQDIAKNTICGLIIMLDGSINVGDFVDVAGQSGTITDTTIRSTTIRTPDGRNVVVPNATLYTQNVVVSSHRKGRVRVTVDVNLAPDTDLPRARELILHATLDTPGILRDPEPEVLFRALAAAALNLQIVAWTDRIEQVAVVQQRLMSRVWETTTAEGIALA